MTGQASDPPAPFDTPRERAWDGWIVAAVALGMATRLSHIIRSDFPLNDGGLFALMIDALRANDYRLPDTIPWGQFDLPFAYPPLAFYMAAAVGDLTGIGTAELLRILPAVGSAAAIVAFAALASSYLADRISAIVAVALFGIMPVAFDWIVAGGGLTRGFGEAFALSTLHHLLIQFREPSRARLATASAFAALTVLTHPESALVLAACAVVLTLSDGRTRDGLRSAAFVGMAVLVLTAPWWVIVVGRHGVGTLVAGGSNAPGTTLLRSLLQVGQPNGPNLSHFLLLFALFASVWWLVSRRAVAGAWFLTVSLVARNVPLYGAPMLALLLGRLAGWLVASSRKHPRAGGPLALRGRLVARLGAFGLLAFLGAWAASANTHAPMPTLAPGERAAMAWIRNGTPSTASFLLLTGRPDRSVIDPAGDWFAALSGRRGFGPPQGTEWLGLYPTVERAYARLLACRSQDTLCLERWAADEALDFEHVYVSKVVASTATPAMACCSPILDSLRSDPAYRLVFEGDGASVFERLESRQ